MFQVRQQFGILWPVAERYANWRQRLHQFLHIGAVEVPANLACLITLEKFGRTKPLAMSMSLAGLVLLTVTLVPEGLSARCYVIQVYIYACERNTE
jgi:hypothetical protein